MSFSWMSVFCRGESEIHCLVFVIQGTGYSLLIKGVRVLQLLDTNAVGVRREKMYKLADHVACAVAGITGE